MRYLESDKYEIYSISRNWFEKSKTFQENDDFFSRFIYLWISFNTLYDFYGDLENENEYQRICSTINTIFNSNNFGLDPKKFINLKSIKGKCEFLINTKIIDIRRFVLNKKLYHLEDLEKYNKTTDDIEKIKLVFNAIYRIRSNLVHGSKGHIKDAIRDKELVEAANEILYYLIEKILNSEYKIN